MTVQPASGWDYRVIGININLTPTPNAAVASQKLGEGFSPEFLEKQFPDEYVAKRSVNMALQCQQVIQIYGRYGWEHYQQGQLGQTAMLYFRRRLDQGSCSVELNPTEQALISKLDPLQQP
jgi:hypothetical protein